MSYTTMVVDDLKIGDRVTWFFELTGHYLQAEVKDILKYRTHMEFLMELTEEPHKGYSFHIYPDFEGDRNSLSFRFKDLVYNKRRRERNKIGPKQ